MFILSLGRPYICFLDCLCLCVCLRACVLNRNTRRTLRDCAAAPHSAGGCKKGSSVFCKSLIVSLTTSHSPNGPEILTHHYFIELTAGCPLYGTALDVIRANVNSQSWLHITGNIVLAVITVRMVVTALFHPLER